jgi:hypothetical protein
MLAQENRPKQRIPAFRRPFETLRSGGPEDRAGRVDLVKWSIYAFLDKLQKRYPFTFAPALRGLPSELNRQTQERLTTHFLLGVIAELSELEPEVMDRVWELGKLLSKQIGRGGENFWPRQFTLAERKAAQDIGQKNYDRLLEQAEELSMAMKFKLGPVNSSEHVLAWCFRYVGQLLKAAKWESVHNEAPKRLAENSPNNSSLHSISTR